MRRPYLTLAVKGWWIAAAGLLVLALLTATNILQLTWGVPLLFWTGYGLLVIVAVGLAIGLPPQQRVFWQALLGSLAVLALFGRQSDSGILFLFNLRAYIVGQTGWISELVGGDAWLRSLLIALIMTAAALVPATAAHFAQRRWSIDRPEGFRFTLAQLFFASTMLALACAALRHPTMLSLKLSQLGLEMVLLGAVAIACASHGRNVFALGFLAGAVAWLRLIDFHQLIFEWDSLWPIARSTGYDIAADDYWGYSRRDVFLRILAKLSPLAAGVLGGVAAALVYRRQQPVTTAQQKAEAKPTVAPPP